MNSTGLPIAKTPVTYSILTVDLQSGQPNDWSKLSVWNWIEQQTNVKFTQTAVTTDNFMNQLALDFAGGDYPDVILPSNVMTWQDQENYIGQGDLVDITDLAKQWMPNMEAYFQKNPSVEADAMASNGKLYGLPYYYEETGGNPCLCFGDNYWLKAAGLSAMPTTTDGFMSMMESVRSAMNAKSADASMYPLGLQTNTTGPNVGTDMFTDAICTDFVGAISGFSTPLCVPDNKTVKFNFNLPGYKDAITYMHQMYTDKIINPDCFTVDLGTFNANVNNYDYFMATDSPSKWDQTKVRGDGFVAMPPLTSANNSQMLMPYENGFLPNGALFTDKCQNLPIILRFFDQFYNINPTDVQNPNMITSMTVYKGRYGINWKQSTDGTTWQWLPPAGTKDPTSFSFPDADNLWVPGWATTPGILLDNTTFEEGSQLYIWKQQATAKYQYPYCTTNTQLPPNMRLMPDELTAVGDNYTNLETYLGTSFAQFVTGQLSLDKDWNTFMSTLNSYNLPLIQQTYQKAYDRYMANAGSSN
jgi:putative aldouronate transport system substrate-binding protein